MTTTTNNPKPAPDTLRDQDLQQYRDVLETPKLFTDGFGWSTVTGVLFCGLIMMPGSIYLGLMSGGNMGAAATWVTVILFTEVMRRALKTPTRQELVVLLYAAGGMASGGVFAALVHRAYLVSSAPVRDTGMRDAFPSWFAPHPDSPAILGRNLLHPEWLAPIGVLVAMILIGFLSKWTLGYFFFRLTSDVERLPFPMAPIAAQGTMALAESDDKPAADGDDPLRLRKRGSGSPRWRLFTLGTSLGIAFGLLQVGVPVITGLFLEKPVFLVPTPWWDTTTVTEGFLPAVATGLVLDLGLVLLGMVLPYWAVIGTALAVVAMLVINVSLHHTGVLTRWQPGMDTINTTFANNIDFWMSFGIGTGLGITIVSVFQTVRDVRKKLRENRAQRVAFESAPRRSIWATPPGRGDFPLWLALAGYLITATATVALSYSLLPQNTTLLLFLIFFAFVYNPLISYVNARLLGISGQSVDIPFVKETAFLLSGAKGIGIWLAPIPVENYGGQAQAFRVNELTGVSFRSLLKADLVVLPASFIFSFIFWAFIWGSSPIPSAAFPWAQAQWELGAKNSVLLYSSTYTPPGQTERAFADSQFMQAIHPTTIGAGAVATFVLFGLGSLFSLPTMLIYGFVRGLGVGVPHAVPLELAGALAGRYYFQRKYGTTNYLRNIPTVLAGYFTGVGLVAMATMALRFIQSAVSSSPL